MKMTSFTTDLLQGVHAFDVDGVPHDDHHDGHGFVDEGERAVFQFARHDAFAVHVRQLLNFLEHTKKETIRSRAHKNLDRGGLSTYQGAFQASGKVEAAAHDQQRLLLVEIPGQHLDLVVEPQNVADLILQVPQAVDDLKVKEHIKFDKKNSVTNKI